MAIDMTTFLPENVIKPLAWLGKFNWLLFEPLDDRFLISPDKDVWKNATLIEKRKQRQPDEFWSRVKSILYTPPFGDKEQLFEYALSRALAFGPKIFRPTSMQCQAFENTAVNIPFEQYAQPYETLLIEFPEEYRRLKLQEFSRCPRFLIAWYNRKLKIIMVSCQFDSQDDKIVGVLTGNSQENGLETLLTNSTCREPDGTLATKVEDFQISLLFERIAINLNMLMMYGGSKIIASPANRHAWAHYRELKSRYKKNRDKRGLERIRQQERDAALTLIDEIKLEQEIGFKVQFNEPLPPNATDKDGVSPKPHWRRGHWANQPYGPGSVLRKPVLRPPVYVVGKAYKSIDINLERTSVVYTQEGEYYQP